MTHKYEYIHCNGMRCASRQRSTVPALPPTNKHLARHRRGRGPAADRPRVARPKAVIVHAQRLLEELLAPPRPPPRRAPSWPIRTFRSTRKRSRSWSRRILTHICQQDRRGGRSVSGPGGEGQAREWLERAGRGVGRELTMPPRRGQRGDHGGDLRQGGVVLRHPTESWKARLRRLRP